jgi:hypothetical protein
MSVCQLLLCLVFSSVWALAENPFDQATREREVARQRAFDRGQKTALPAAEEREAIGRLPAESVNAKRSVEGRVINQGPPAAAVYNRVMETRRHFRDNDDPYLWNANDTFTNSPALAESVRKEAQILYPDLSKPDSAFALRFTAINRWIDSRQPPLAKDSRRMMLVAHMVSLELTGGMAADSMGLAQIPMSQQMGANTPTVLKHASFDIEVKGERAFFPEGLVGKVTRGGLGSPDIIEWLDAEGTHQISLPQQTEGSVLFSATQRRAFQRTQLLNGDFRVRFFLEKP